MRIGIASDMHAGLGRDDPALRRLQTAAVKAAAGYLSDAELDEFVINGDATDHLANALAADTSLEIARDVFEPIVDFIRERRGTMRAVCTAGNTDWPLAEPDPRTRQVYFDATGLSPEDVTVPSGALLYGVENDDVLVSVTHGHACKPEQWGHAGPMEAADYSRLLAKLREPDRSFLDAISAVSGSHRADYLKALAIGYVVRPMPRFARRAAVGFLGGAFTAEYEGHAAGLLDAIGRGTRKKVLGVMGHTHVAGIRNYHGRTVLNAGTAGAKPNPLQRYSDPRGHVAVVDTDRGTFELVQTFNAARPNAAPTTVGNGSFDTL